MSEVGDDFSLEKRVLTEWADELGERVKNMDCFSSDPNHDHGMRHFLSAAGGFVGFAGVKSIYDSFDLSTNCLDFLAWLAKSPYSVYILDGLALGYGLGELIDIGRNLKHKFRTSNTFKDGAKSFLSDQVLQNSRFWGIAGTLGTYTTGTVSDLELAIIGGVILGGIHSGSKRALKQIQGVKTDGLVSKLAEKPVLYSAAFASSIAVINHGTYDISKKADIGFEPFDYSLFPFYLPFGALNALKERKEDLYEAPKILQMPSRLGTAAAALGAGLSLSGYIPLEGMLLSNAAGIGVELGIRGARNALLMRRHYQAQSQAPFRRSISENLKMNFDLVIDSVKVWYQHAQKLNQKFNQTASKIVLNIYQASSGFMSDLAKRRKNNVLLNYFLFGPTRVPFFYIEGVRLNSVLGTKRIRTASFSDVLRRATFFEKAKDVYWDFQYGYFGGRLHDKITLASRHALRGNYEKAISIAQRVLEQKPDNLFANLAHGYFFLHGKGDPGPLTESINSMLEDETIRKLFDATATGTRNEVRLHRKSIPSLDLIVVRKFSDDKKKLETEIKNIGFYAQAVPNNIPRVLGSIISHKDGSHEMRQLHAGMTVFDYFRDLNSFKEYFSSHNKYLIIESVVLLLAKCHFHFLRSETKDEFDNPLTSAVFNVPDGNEIVNIRGGKPAYFTNRIESVLFGNYKKAGIDVPEATSILDDYAPINNALNKQLPLVHYLDFNLRNITISTGEILKIDLEGKKVLPNLLEIVNACEFERTYLTDNQRQSLLGLYHSVINTQEESQDKLIRAYIESRNTHKSFLENNAFLEHFGQTHTQSLLLQYSLAGVQRHLELQGYRVRDFAAAQSQDDKYRHCFYAAYHQQSALSHLETALQLMPAEDSLKSLRKKLESTSFYLEAPIIGSP